MAAAIMMVFAGAVHAQEDRGTGFIAAQLQRQLDQQDALVRQAYLADTPISERLLLDASGTFRYAFNVIDNSQSQSQILRTYDSRLSARADLDGMHRFYGRLRLMYNEWDFGNTAGPGPDSETEGWQQPVGELYWYELDLAGSSLSSSSARSDDSAVMRVGRQYVIWAQGVSLTGYMYALTLDFSMGDIGIKTLFGQTAGQDTIDWDVSRPGFDNDTKRSYFGVQLEYTGLPRVTPFAYVLAQVDGNAGQTAMLPAGLPIIPTEFNYESTYIGWGATGSIGADWIYRGELVYEFGSTLSDSLDPSGGIAPQTQVTDPISAFGMVIGTTWLARDEGDTRLDLQLALGTGESTRLDSGNTFGGPASNTTDHSFNSLGYINTGLVLAPELANIICPSVGWGSNPIHDGGVLDGLRLGATGYLFFKTDAYAPISVPTLVGGPNFVGGEMDLTLDWRVLSDFSVSLKYGLFIPNSTVFAPDEGGLRQFLYMGATYSF